MVDMNTSDEETALSGGGRTAVYRRGQIVVRETGPWGATVHTLLRHLEDVGFAGSPRVVGSGFDEGGRETLTYIEGESGHLGPWTLDAVDRLRRGARPQTPAAPDP